KRPARELVVHRCISPRPIPVNPSPSPNTLGIMFLHRKELIQPVNVGKPDAAFGQFLLEQFGGATGELTAALQYWVQSFHVENAAIRDMLQDIAIEEFSHLEMVGKLIAQHTSKIDQKAASKAPIFKIKGGGPHFL